MQDDKKYIIFTPYRCGLGNVMMSIELALSIAYITKRILIVPATCWSYGLSGYNDDKKSWIDIWKIFDFDQVKKEFDVMLMSNVEELANIVGLGNSDSHIGNIANFNLDMYKFNTINENAQSIDDNICFVNNASQYSQSEDYLNFVSDRPVIDLDRPEKYLVFDSVLFGHYWYQIYPGSSVERNTLKNKVNSCIAYKKYYRDIANEKVKQTIGPYNAVHVRRGDFSQYRTSFIENVNSGEKMLTALKQLFPTDLPLYIATDEPDKDFFKVIATEYKIYFYNSFDFNLSKLEETILDQIICSQAESFYGTYISTFSKRINIMRGLENKQAYDYMGINHIVEHQIEKTGYPWIENSSKRWRWHDSSYPQWTQE